MYSKAVIVGEVGGLSVVISCNGRGGPLYWNRHMLDGFKFSKDDKAPWI